MTGVDSDPRHPDQRPGGHDPVTDGGPLILVVDDHEPVGPATGDPFGEEEDDVRQATATLVEVESMRRVGNGRGGARGACDAPPDA